MSKLSGVHRTQVSVVFGTQPVHSFRYGWMVGEEDAPPSPWWSLRLAASVHRSAGFWSNVSVVVFASWMCIRAEVWESRLTGCPAQRQWKRQFDHRVDVGETSGSLVFFNLFSQFSKRATALCLTSLFASISLRYVCVLLTLFVLIK